MPLPMRNDCRWSALLLIVCGLLILSPVSAHARQTGSAARIEGMYTLESFRLLHGGISTGGGVLGNLDLTGFADLGALGGPADVSFFLYLLANHGGAPSGYAGDLQTLSNIEAPAGWNVYEAWVERKFASDRTSVLFGLYDLNSEFDVNQTGSLFLNSSHGIGGEFGQAGTNGPSIFPATSTAIRLRALAGRHSYIQGAVLDGVPGAPGEARGTWIRWSRADGILWALEAGMTDPADHTEGPLAGSEHSVRHARVSREGGLSWRRKLAIGVWGFSEAMDPLEVGQEPAPSRGAYLLAESEVSPDLSLFLRVGLAEPRVNRIGTYLGVGAVLTGPFRSGENTQAGIAVAHAMNGDPWMRAARSSGADPVRGETDVEITYAHTFGGRLTLQGDVQYILAPGTDRSVPDALVGLLRISVEF